MVADIVNQLSLALENTRLQEETQRRAELERLTGEVTDRIRQSLDMDTILQTAVREFGELLGVSDVIIRMDVNGSEDQREAELFHHEE